jgi:hypothetical protein
MAMNASLRRLGFVLLLAAAAAGADGKTYRWVDAQGNVHYGDQPPANATVVAPKPTDSAAPSPPPASTAAASGLGPEECDRRQKQLDSYKAASSITETDGLGNKREYSEDERNKLIARTEQAIRDGCPAN